MLTVFYILVAIVTLFIILSLQVVRAHDRKLDRREEQREETPLPVQEDEFFESPIYKVMEVIARL